MNVNGWALVPLGELLTQSSERVSVSVDAEYPNFGIYSFGRGLFAKTSVKGSTSSATTLFRAKSNQFVYSRLFAFEGAYGVVSEEFDGHFVSNEFPLFNCNSARLLPGYLGWFFRNPRIWSDVARLTTGMGDRRQRVKPESLLNYKLPLPPVEEQRRILDRIESLASKVEKVRRLTRELAVESDFLAVSLAHRSDLSVEAKKEDGWREVLLRDVVKISFDDHRVIETEQYQNFGLYSYGRGLFAKPPIEGVRTSATRLRRVHAGQFIYSQLFAWEGAFGVVTPEYDGWFVSSEYPTFNCDERQILPEFLFAYFKAEHVWSTVAAGSRGLGNRRKRVHPDQLLEYRLMVPPLASQRILASTLLRNSDLHDKYQATSRAIVALLPSILDRAFKGEL